MEVAARNPFTSGESTCCDIRSGDQRPVRTRVSTGKTTMLPTQPMNPRPATTSGALTTRRWIQVGTTSPAGGTQRTMGHRYAMLTGTSTP